MRSTADIIRGFIVFEGIDGAGTSTQLKRLDEALERNSVPRRIHAEPTGSAIGKLIRQALSGSAPLHEATVAHLFAADRNEHVHAPDGILSSCAQGNLVVCDRYLFSSLAYQGLTCGPDLPYRLNQDFPLPELLLFFGLPAETGIERMKNRTALEIYEKLDFQQKVASHYEQILAMYEGSGMRIVRLDAGASIEEVERQVWLAVEPLARRLKTGRDS